MVSKIKNYSFSYSFLDLCWDKQIHAGRQECWYDKLNFCYYYIRFLNRKDFKHLMTDFVIANENSFLWI